MNDVKSSFTLPQGTRIEIVQGDITREHVDAIVNAANSILAHGGGVAAAIVRAGGDIIQEESDAWVLANGPVSHEEPAYTNPGKLSCRYIFHAVGPIWGEGEEDRKLEEAIRGSLNLAARLQLHSLAFPAISTGIYDFPKERAAGVFFQTFREYFSENPHSPVELVRMTLWDDEAVEIFQTEARQIFGPE